ncbi:MAG: chemotaxis protein CheW [Deltaproteobacteria bacterium]|jgi:chemotaxis protein histidine kinase CheA|nr:chemotaxis protein CheW [Deltaproteobacteria bacterium]
MIFSEDRVSELLNRASLDLVMISKDNLLEFSSLLGLAEELGEAFAPQDGPDETPPACWPPRIVESLVSVLRLAVLDQLPDVDQAVDLVGRGLGLLDELSRCLPVGAPFQGDAPGFLKAADTLELRALEKLMSADDDGGLFGSSSDSADSSDSSSDDGETASEDAPASDDASAESSDDASAGSSSSSSSAAFFSDAAGASVSAAGDAAAGLFPGAAPEEPLPDPSLVAPVEDPPAPDESGGGARSAFQPRKKGDGVAFIVPTPTQARRDVLLLTQNLTVDYFKADFIGSLEDLQMKLVSIEQKSDPVSAMAETLPKFRAILGGLSLLDLDDLARLAADTIGLIDYVVGEQVPHTTVVTDILLKACSFMISGLATMGINPDGRTWSIRPQWSADDLLGIRENLWAARQGILTAEPPSAAASSGAAQAAKPKKLGEILVEKGLISEGDLGGLIQAQKSVRSVRLGEILVKENLITEDELQQALARQQGEDKGRRVGEILVTMGLLEHEHVDKALKIQEGLKETKLGEIILKQKIGAPEKVAAALREQKQSEGLSASAGAGAGLHTVKVETQKLDGLIDLVGELVITQSLITSNDSIKDLKEQKINKDLAQVSRITSELQRNAMSLRMVQISNTFRKMSRLVRDLAHKFEKDVEFQTSGDDTEIDRNMVESLYDPLVHMIRNSLDHGLELPKERLANGKSPKGLVALRAYHQGGNVVIELSDDGRGLDVDKVVKKAVEKGFLQPGETPTQAVVHNLVFQPGFSTTDKVTEISGRGVGMDVVKKSIELMRGKVDFASAPNQGSVFTIRLPLTLAIIDGMIVRVGENRYILPTISINQSFRPKPEEYFTVKNQGEMIKVRDRLLPLVRLNRLVNVSGAVSDPARALVVVVENEGQRCCLMVDEVLGKQEVVIKSLGERLKYVRTLAGGTILGDGRVGLILDVNGLFESEEGSGMIPGSGGGTADDWDMDDGSFN